MPNNKPNSQTVITKERINELKKNNLHEIYGLLKDQQDSGKIRFVLENLGFLPSNFDGNILIPFIHHHNNDIRFWAVKNIGKIPKIEYLELLYESAKQDPNSMVRREAVSSIGRMRLVQGQKMLMSFLNDDDPKVVLQAIRGLLVFKGNEAIKAELVKLENHPNEMIQSVIRREFSKNGKGSPNNIPHPVSPEFLKDTVVNGDVRDVLKYVPDESIHLTFTSPPYYNARDYSIYVSYNAYLDFLTEVFNDIHRITKEGRFLIVNTSPVIIPRVSRAHASKRYPIPFDLHYRLVENGWEFIDDIIWVKPETSAKNRNAGFLQHRKPLAYKPNAITEYLMVYRKQTDKLLDWNMNQYNWDTIEKSRVKGNYETSNVWKIDPTFDRIHTAVFPLELCNRVITFYSYVGDLVFDPFGGSGTFGKSARNLERFFFLTEKEPKYVERMKLDLGKTNLFDGRSTRFLTLQEFISQRKGHELC